MFLYLLLEQTENNKKLLSDNGFNPGELYEGISRTQYILYTESYSAFKVSYTTKIFPNSVIENLTRMQIESSQIPQIATLFNLGIYGEDLIPLLT